MQEGEGRGEPTTQTGVVASSIGTSGKFAKKCRILGPSLDPRTQNLHHKNIPR